MFRYMFFAPITGLLFRDWSPINKRQPHFGEIQPWRGERDNPFPTNRKRCANLQFWSTVMRCLNTQYLSSIITIILLGSHIPASVQCII
ncbi:hypothetical protein L6164_012775 [Bauhinia variegata]|uniref:Uncharacterized protein n=1 Tax=Bauhinia variegata TaxID=167791 RepID=A0ACB9PB22_BAUVA|nr:hypothetical protein L6164_012775 [Bauhinia variegata]